MNDLIIFDLDGVITSEEAYWDAAGLTLHELMYSPSYWGIGASKNYAAATTAEESRDTSRSTLPESEIMAYKARSINSNWDTCYVAVCLRLIDALALLQKQVPGTISDLLPLRPWDSDWIAAFREKMARCGEEETGGKQVGDAWAGGPKPGHARARHPHAGHSRARHSRGGHPHAGHPKGVPLPYTKREDASRSMVGAPLAGALFAGVLPASALNIHIFDVPPFQGYTGLELINRFDNYASAVLEIWRYQFKVFSRATVRCGHFAGIFFKSGTWVRSFIRERMGMLRPKGVSQVVFISNALSCL